MASRISSAQILRTTSEKAAPAVVTADTGGEADSSHSSVASKLEHLTSQSLFIYKTWVATLYASEGCYEGLDEYLSGKHCNISQVFLNISSYGLYYRSIWGSQWFVRLGWNHDLASELLGSTEGMQVPSGRQRALKSGSPGFKCWSCQSTVTWPLQFFYLKTILCLISHLWNGGDYTYLTSLWGLHDKRMTIIWNT